MAAAALLTLAGLPANAAQLVPIDGCFPDALKANSVGFAASDGTKLSGVVLGTGSKGVTLGHANGWNVCSWLPFAQKLADHGYQVILWSYRNNEPSAPAKGEAHYRLDLDVRAAVDVLISRGVTKILAAGASLGGTSSAVAAPDIPQLAGLALLSSPRKFGAPPRISALDAVKKVTVPSFFAISSHDPTGDYASEIRALYEASAASRKELVVIDDSEHGTDMLSATPQGTDLSNKLWTFVTSVLGEPAQPPSEPAQPSTSTTPSNLAAAPINEGPDRPFPYWIPGTALVVLALASAAALKLNRRRKEKAEA